MASVPGYLLTSSGTNVFMNTPDHLRRMATRIKAAGIGLPPNLREITPET